MISEFNRFFKSKTLASTYKPTLAKCLLDLGDYVEDEGGNWVKIKDDTYTVDLHFVAALGYADVPAKTIVTDQYYAYGVTECSAAIKSATRG